MVYYFQEVVTASAATILLSIFTLYWMVFDTPYRSVNVKKPLVYTPRMIRLAVMSYVVIVSIPLLGSWSVFLRSEFLFDIYPLSLFWVITYALIPLWIVFAAWLIHPLEKNIQQRFIRQAKDKLKRLSHIKVIAITGSYGKTSTKFAIKDILKQRYHVCFTPGSYNTPMGITKVINEDLEATHELLILEMGARYRGNIDELCDIAQPDISVVTNIGVAHLETFGSRENIRDTKAALVRRLKPEGLAILNADDAMVLSMQQREDIRYVTAGIHAGDIQAKNIVYNANGCQFELVLPTGEVELITTRLLGAHNIQNLLLGVSVGLALGLRLPTIALAIKEMEPVEHRLELKQKGGITIIDDAFNSNPIGAQNAVEILSQFTGGRRVIITPGMVELGENEAKYNFEFGLQIGRGQLDRIFLVGVDRTKPIHEGIMQSGEDMSKVTVVSSLFEANKELEVWLLPGDIILYENDLPDVYT
jgi:UDP-N-acetylmuramoyl-tripeptide--D-alanyl-D-alanine ligase